MKESANESLETSPRYAFSFFTFSRTNPELFHHHCSHTFTDETSTFYIFWKSGCLCLMQADGCFSVSPPLSLEAASAALSEAPPQMIHCCHGECHPLLPDWTCGGKMLYLINSVKLHSECAKMTLFDVLMSRKPYK